MSIKDTFNKLFSKKEPPKDNADKSGVIDYVVNFIETHKEYSAKYEKINNDLEAIQPEFSSCINMIDSTLENTMIELVDKIIFDMTGSDEICLHILYDRGKVIEEVDGEEVEIDLCNKDVLTEWLKAHIEG